MTEEASADGGRTQAYTVRLELNDEPGELLNALEPIADHGANLLSIFHERGNLTPRGRIPVEVDIECHPDRFESITDALRAAGVNVVQAGEERYGEELSVLLVGQLIDADLSDTVSQLESCTGASVTDLSLLAPDGVDETASAHVRLATEPGRAQEVLSTVRDLAADKELLVVEPQIDPRGDG